MAQIRMHDTTEQVTTRGRQHGWLFTSLLCLGLICSGMIWSSSGHAATLKAFSEEEYKWKAELFLAFCRFSEWPARPFQSPDHNYTIGVLGEDPLTPYLESLPGETCLGHDVEVVRYSMTDDYTQPHTLFIGQSEQRHVDTVLARLKGKAVLTIADFAGFAEAGGMVGFTYQDMPYSTIPNARRVRFKINAEVLEAADIRLGIQVVKFAQVVQTQAPMDEAEDERINIAILPPWEFYVAPLLSENGPAMYRSLGSHEDVSIGYAADRNLAQKLGARLIELDKSERERIWKKASKTTHSTPNLEVIEQLVNGLALDAVFLYSLPADFDPGVRAYLVDLKSGKIYQNTKSTQGTPSGQANSTTDPLVRELLSNYLEDRDKIRVAILPARNLNNTIQLKSDAVFQSLANNSNIQVTHVAEKKLARDMGAKELKTSRSQQKDIWKKAGFDQNTEPDIEAVIAMAKNLDVRLALMYSFPHSTNSYLSNLQIFMVDVETGELFVSERRNLAGSIGTMSASVKDMANNLIRDYLEGTAKPQASVTEIQHLLAEATLMGAQ